MYVLTKFATPGGERIVYSRQEQSLCRLYLFYLPRKDVCSQKLKLKVYSGYVRVLPLVQKLMSADWMVKF